MNIFDLKIDEDLQGLLRPLTEEEYSGLEKDIVSNGGIISPIVIWDGYIVDGHNRYKICKAHGYTDVPVKELLFHTKSDAMIWAREHQNHRRNESKIEALESLEKIEKQIAAEAKERQMSTLKQNSVSANLPKRVEPVHTSETMAKMLGVSEHNYRDRKLIKNEGTPEQIQRFEKGGKGNGVSAIANEIRQEKEAKEETKICYICKKEYPISKFKKGTNRCLYCNRARNKRYDSEKRTGYSEALVKAMKDVKDPDRDRSVTFETFYTELEVMVDSFLNGWRSALEQNASLITDDNKDKINSLLKGIPTLGICE